MRFVQSINNRRMVETRENRLRRNHVKTGVFKTRNISALLFVSSREFRVHVGRWCPYNTVWLSLTGAREKCTETRWQRGGWTEKRENGLVNCGLAMGRGGGRWKLYLTEFSFSGSPTYTRNNRVRDFYSGWRQVYIRVTVRAPLYGVYTNIYIYSYVVLFI